VTTRAPGAGRLVAVAHFRVFERPGGGNPCPIVGDATSLSAEEMQRIAAHLGEESGFVCHEEDGGLRLRYFMPRREVAMCVHATVAASTWLVLSGKAPPTGEQRVRTESGECLVSWDDAGEDGSSPRVTVEQQPPWFGKPFGVGVATAAERALRLAGCVDKSLPIRAVSVSTPKLLVPLLDASLVHQAAPDFDLLSGLCEELGTTGAYVFAPRPDGIPGHFVARQFPTGGGVEEDAATGVAAGALAAYVADQEWAGASAPSWRAIEIDQGDAMGCPCRLEAAAYAVGGVVLRTTVTGRASLTGEEELDLSAVPE
jgi:trans-2,3-dihydro-3-hydroxyanthranilate isomerase